MAGIDHNPFSYGKITTNIGTKRALTYNFASDAEVVAAPMSYLMVKALPTNTDNVFIGYSDMNTTTLAGVVAIIGPGESFAVGHPNVSTIQVRDLYLDVSVNGEGVLAAGYQH